ncbi:MAG: Maf family nucleotide pyrophosphatase [Rikenellaceae bacterium]
MILEEKIERLGMELILASQSPRRRQLMADAGLKCRTVKYDVDEVYPQTIAAEEVAPYLSRLKSDGYPEPLAENEILITADTVVILGDMVLGKPADEESARVMLSELSGREHRVVTGVTLRSRGMYHTFSTETRVCFAPLSEDEIDHYVLNYKPLDKAGSYGIQEWIGYIGVERIDGSFYNVMGLPVQRLYRELGEFINNL